MDFLSSLKDHRHLLFVCLLYMALVIVITLMSGVDIQRFLFIVLFFSLVPFFYFPLLIFVCVMKSIRHNLSLSDLLLRVQSNWDDFIKSKQAKNGFAGLLAITPLLIFFCIIKSLFPVLAPKQWDDLFAQWDLHIHGNYPHEILMPMVQNWNLEVVAEQIYIVWFLFMFLANFYCLFFDRDTLRRKQYLWSFALCWIISGTILALAFYSAGPIFYHLIYEGAANPYSNLVTWLSTASNGEPVNALKSGMFLYTMAHDGLSPDYNGPSAMPSQHVAVAWLMALYAFKFRASLGIAMTFYTLGILLSSIVLGWHYAVDGYVGIVVVTLIWITVGTALKWKAQHERTG